MKKVSNLYRNDVVGGLDPELRERLDDVYLSRLENIHAANPKILVVFSGGNAVGKSTLAKLIGDEFKALVLENDAIKRSILEIIPDIDRANSLNPLTWQYSMDLYGRVQEITNNGLIVRDGIIDWYFDRILPVFEENGYRIFVVQFEVTKDKAIEMIKKRGDTPTVTVERLMQQLEDHEIHQSRFRIKYTADVVLREDNLYDHGFVLRKLKSVIDEMELSSS